MASDCAQRFPERRCFEVCLDAKWVCRSGLIKPYALHPSAYGSSNTIDQRITCVKQLFVRVSSLSHGYLEYSGIGFLDVIVLRKDDKPEYSGQTSLFRVGVPIREQPYGIPHLERLQHGENIVEQLDVLKAVLQIHSIQVTSQSYP